MSKFLILFFMIVSSCNTGNLIVLADIPKDLEEVSGTEIIPNSNLIWMLNDSGNASKVYGVSAKGKIEKELKINAKNNDWEDLTSDKLGNLYIGDFGNNNKKRKEFEIYKVENPCVDSNNSEIEKIEFKLPKKMKSQDFEAFFLLNDYFYIFSKDDDSTKLIKVPNIIGYHTAEFIADFKFDSKDNKITSADVNEDGNTIVLLCHDKLWKITNFKTDNFFEGNMEVLKFEHTSQKEGVCFENNINVLITDELKKNDGGNLYRFNLN